MIYAKQVYWPGLDTVACDIIIVSLEYNCVSINYIKSQYYWVTLTVVSSSTGDRAHKFCNNEWSSTVLVTEIVQVRIAEPVESIVMDLGWTLTDIRGSDGVVGVGEEDIMVETIDVVGVIKETGDSSSKSL